MNRKTLINEYKNTPIVGGVFAIKNRQNNKLFLGSSLNLHGPWNRVKSELTFGCHSNRELQEDWKRYGESEFAFEILETLKPELERPVEKEHGLKALEEKWISFHLSPGHQNYNTNHKIRMA